MGKKLYLDQISKMEFVFSISGLMVFELPEFISKKQIIEVVRGLEMSGVAGGCTQSYLTLETFLLNYCNSK